VNCFGIFDPTRKAELFTLSSVSHLADIPNPGIAKQDYALMDAHAGLTFNDIKSPGPNGLRQSC
jgi:hypothetical protein